MAIMPSIPWCQGERPVNSADLAGVHVGVEE
jgi:hypothetical protein